MKYLLLPVLLLAGCSTTVPVTMKFPDAPTELIQACEALEKIPADSKQLSVTSEVVVRNYGRYHNCANRVEAWQDWHKKQKENFESVK